MNKNKKIISTAGALALALLVSAAHAAKPGTIQPSGSGVVPIKGGSLRGMCPDGTTEFKDQFLSITNGPDGGTADQTYRVLDPATGGYVDVTLMLTYYGESDGGMDNSFDFKATGGLVHKLKVKAADAYLYNYDPAVAEDTALNLGKGGAHDVSHLDFCLSPPVPNSPPTISGTPPTTVEAGTLYSFTPTVSDDDGDTLTFSIAAPTELFNWATFDSTTGTLSGTPTNADAGLYEDITITVLDGEDSADLGPFSIEVMPNNTSDAGDCLEGADEIPDNQVGIGGCNPSGFQIVELPNQLDGLLDGETITQFAAPAILQSDTCGGPVDPSTGLRPYELVAQDPRVDENTGAVILEEPLDLSMVFDLSGGFAPNGLILRADTVGSPCLALIVGDASFSFADFYDNLNGAPLQNTGEYTYAITQFPEAVPGMFTLSPVGDLSPSQTDLQFVPQATYSQDDRLLLVEQAASPFTSDVINPQRKLTPGFSWFLLNTREVCLFLDPALPYEEAVFECKRDLAIEYFDNLEQALIDAEPNLLDPSLNNLLTDVNKARSMVKVGRWNKATRDLTDLYDQVVGGLWIVDERNDPGILVMRIQNLFFRIEQLEQAESYLP